MRPGRAIAKLDPAPIASLDAFLDRHAVAWR
jgi:hypothetical protein